MITDCRVPLLMLVTMRGEWDEFNPWQIPMGRSVAPVLQQMRLHDQGRRRRGGGADRERALQLAFNGDRAVAVLMSQQLIGGKCRKIDRKRRSTAARRGERLENAATRSSSPGSAPPAGTWPRRRQSATFTLWGAMGGTAMIGLGLALAQPKRRVLVITGDGDMLMGLGSSPRSARSGRRISRSS